MIDPSSTDDYRWTETDVAYMLGPNARLARDLETFATLCRLVDCVTEPLAWVYGSRWLPRAQDNALRCVLLDLDDMVGR